MNYITIDTVISRFYRNYKTTLNISDAVIWVSEALNHINANIKGQETVGFLQVDNYQCLLPLGCKRILQLSLNKSSSITPLDINADLEINIIDDATVELSEIPSLNVIPYFEGAITYIGWMSAKTFNKFEPITLANHSFFNSIVCKETEIYSNNVLEYTVIENSILRFNFKEGQIAISYIKEKLDERGYPMIPDDISFLTAIEKYILLQIINFQYFSHVEGSMERKQNADKEWQFYCRQAKNKGLLPSSIDDYESLLKSQVHLVKDSNRYEKYFK